MGKVEKKEIRVTYYLNNDEDNKIYKELVKHTQPGRFIKEIVANFINDKKNKTTDINLETLKLIEQLVNKIEHLNIGQQIINDDSHNENNKSINGFEIDLNEDVNSDDLDDIEF